MKKYTLKNSFDDDAMTIISIQGDALFIPGGLAKGSTASMKARNTRRLVEKLIKITPLTQEELFGLSPSEIKIVVRMNYGEL